MKTAHKDELVGLYRTLYSYWSRDAHGMSILDCPLELSEDKTSLRAHDPFVSVEGPTAVDSLLGISLTFLDWFLDRFLADDRSLRGRLDRAKERKAELLT